MTCSPCMCLILVGLRFCWSCLSFSQVFTSSMLGPGDVCALALMWFSCWIVLQYCQKAHSDAVWAQAICDCVSMTCFNFLLVSLSLTAVLAHNRICLSIFLVNKSPLFCLH